ncbi:MAG: hypothetical protein ACRCWW_14585 [Scandinavium sp.]|uniref:hypothetical protein n=1 Tax=Scandinavium sp. TaxID=2830653 RepID=UPI003F2CE8D3
MTLSQKTCLLAMTNNFGGKWVAQRRVASQCRCTSLNMTLTTLKRNQGMVAKQYLNVHVERILKSVTAQPSVANPLRPTPLLVLKDVHELSPSVKENPSGATVQPESIALFTLDRDKEAMASRLAEALPLSCFSTHQGVGDIFVPPEKLLSAFQEAFTHFSVIIVLDASLALSESLSALACEIPSMPVLLLIHAKPQPVIHSLFPEGKQASALMHFVSGFLKCEVSTSQFRRRK